MKILHLCLASFYIDNFSYQENLLPKYHKKMGEEVEIIASLFSFNQSGKPYFQKGKKEYVNENGIKITRLEYKNNEVNKVLRRYQNLYESLEHSNPDIIFIHGCQFLDIKYVVKYLQINPQVTVYVDNHADFYNSGRNWFSKNILHRIIWKYCAKIIEPFTTKFYGVLPLRVSFLTNIYKLPKEKVDLLVMGADDENIDQATCIETICATRHKFNIEKKDFLIVTGGKIDFEKINIFDLINAVKKLNNYNVKLIVFGPVIDELKERILEVSTVKNVSYIGWIDNNLSYELFSAADLVFFPMKHSVYWEQVVACGTPLVVPKFEEIDHIDIGGNCIFLDEVNETEITNVLVDILTNNNTYNSMKKAASSTKRLEFLYSEIAAKSIESYKK